MSPAEDATPQNAFDGKADMRYIPRDEPKEPQAIPRLGRREFVALCAWRAVQCGAGAILVADVFPAIAAVNANCGVPGGPAANTCSAVMSGPSNTCPGTNTCSNAAGTGNKCTGGTLTGNECTGNNNCLGTGPGGNSNKCSGSGSTTGANSCDGAGASNFCSPAANNECTDSGVGAGNACDKSGAGATNTCKSSTGSNTCATPSPNWCGKSGTSTTSNVAKC